MNRIRTGPLSLDEVVAEVSADSAGAVVTFVGTVRNHNAGLSITKLEYEAYESMAEREMQRIIDEICAKETGLRAAALHRVGSLSVGDSAVVCAVSAAHREQAFAACRTLIDLIKERVPIWKREHGDKGPYWVNFQDARVQPDGTPAAADGDASGRGGPAPRSDGG